MASENDGGSYDSVPLEEQTTQSLEQRTSLQPLELDDGAPDGIQREEETPQDVFLFRLTDPWLLSVAVILFLIIPVLVSFIILIRHLIGRIWPTTLFALHLIIVLWTAMVLTPRTTTATRPSICRRLIPSMLDMILFGSVYASVCNVFVWNLFTDIDGTPVLDYQHYRHGFGYLRLVGMGIAMMIFAIEAIFLSFTWLNRQHRNVNDDYQLPRMFASAIAWTEHLDDSISMRNKRRFMTWSMRVLMILFTISVGIFCWSLISVMIHCVSWSAPKQQGPQCDPLDTTECCLPFPSFHHMVEDNTTDTGYRVALEGNVLPPLKGDIRLDPFFLNKLDGFSTMAPMLFYLEGLKEAQERASNDVRLQGPEDIALSVTSRSVTLLVDVKAQALVAHSAEIDYLDSDRPLVMVFPAKPLNHNRHYALAVLHATDVRGNLISPTLGMKSLLSGQDDKVYRDRRERYENILIPALSVAAPWFSYERNPDGLQLLFDFQTISATSQLGPIRAVRDATLAYIDGPEWGDWSKHVRTVTIVEGQCSRGALVARTVHAELDVPWFLGAFGRREATLDVVAVSTSTPTTIGRAKFVVHIPCSLRAAAIKGADAKELRAVMEYGHGLFYNRNEASDQFLLAMANANGYIITAMDWRGMSSFDLLMVVKVLMSTPKTFEAVRDNLIQGYANKLALQHFTRHGLLDLDWIRFKTGSNQHHSIPLYQGLRPPSIFYGISQGATELINRSILGVSGTPFALIRTRSLDLNSPGGILGAGYSALSGPTKLIDRSILGVPGTPFALILTRSLDFNGYDKILLLNFYNNRHVRILLSLVQMAWDPAEGSGMLAPPLTEPFPPTLLQAGLGDVEVPTVACEALARGLGASTLPNSPREIFEMTVVEFTDARLGSEENPPAVLTELLYVKEYAELPVGDKTRHFNSVHFCVRQDPLLIRQLTTFANDAKIIDPCKDDGCIRKRVTCGVAE